jgi:hypothetical protein
MSAVWGFGVVLGWNWTALTPRLIPRIFALIIGLSFCKSKPNKLIDVYSFSFFFIVKGVDMPENDLTIP